MVPYILLLLPPPPLGLLDTVDLPHHLVEHVLGNLPGLLALHPRLLLGERLQKIVAFRG
jgi:hypothetical protein